MDTFQYGAMAPPNSPVHDGTSRPTEEGVLLQNNPGYDLVSMESFMKSAASYDELFSAPIEKVEELFGTAERETSDPTPFLQGPTDYEDYLKKSARREEGKKFKDSEDEID